MADRPVDPMAWQPLLERLKLMEREVWPDLSKSMGFRETEQFARDLLDHAERVGCVPVRDYASELLDDVHTFELEAQEKSLRAFPELISRVERLMEPSA